MKSKSQKYEEAITRNLKTHEAVIANGGPTPEVWTTAHRRRNMSLESLKHLIGIREEDTRFDHLPCLNLSGNN